MNKLEIKHKRTNEIIMTIEYNLIKELDLRFVNLNEADLNEANLIGADLSWANFNEAENINYDNLIGSNIYNIKINTDDIFIEILGYKYTAYIFKNYMKIGCKLFSHSKWLRFWKVKKLDSGEIFKEYFSQEQLEMIYICVKKQNDKLKKGKDNENTK